MLAVGITLLVLSCAALGEIALWLVVGYRSLREAREAPVIIQALQGPQPAQWPRVSIVVPAHNEQRVVEACVRSILASDYPEFELILVLDRCTDRTRAILEPIAASDARLRIVDNDSCPPDWAGKCNAARVGASHARHELLLFTDADTTFDPRLLRGSVAMLLARGWQMVSLFSAPTHNHWFENVVQPQASFLLLKLFPIRRANAAQNRGAFANGQFMLFDRAAYDKLGGHTAVKDDLLEDLGFARRMKRDGMGQGVGVSGGLLRVSMYDSWPAFRSGWKRIFMESCYRNPARMRGQARQALAMHVLLPALRVATVALAVWALVAGWPQAQIGAIVALTLGIMAWCMRMGVLSIVHTLCQFPVWAVFFSSIAGSALASILLEGARDLVQRTPVRWGGKQYVLEPTDR